MASDSDLLYGLPAIAGQLGLRCDQVRHLAKKHGLPVFRVGRSVCARRSSLVAWVAELEAGDRSYPNEPSSKTSADVR